jgi:DNA sulfur modification protein DndB
MPENGQELNKRVWSLFEKAGFQTTPNSQNPNEEVIRMPTGTIRTPDLVADIPGLDVKIIGENTISHNPPESFTTYVHDIEEIIGITHAKAGLLVFTQFEVSEANMQYAKQRHIQVWQEKDLHYFESVVDSIGTYAKYELINSFGLSTVEETQIHNVLAIKFSQPFPESPVDLFMFTVPPEKLLKTCVIYRRVRGSGEAYQRMVSKKRLGSVKKYVTSSGAILPPNLIVHLGDNVTWNPIQLPNRDRNNNQITIARERDYELGILSIPLKYASIELIDGQHRLFGFATANQTLKEHFNLSVIGLKKLEEKKKREIFIAINDKMRRVDANLVTYLKYTDNESECQAKSELMAIKIVVELNKTSPFKNKIKLFDIGEQIITLKGFAGYDLKTLLGTKGLLRQYYPNNDSREYITALRLYFSVLQNMFRVQWHDPEKYIILTNRGISAFLKVLKSILKNCRCQITEEIIRMYLQPIKDGWPSGNWERERLIGVYVGAAGWRRFHQDLIHTIQQTFSDFEE